MSLVKLDVRNKKAFFNFEIVDQLTAGIVLRGTEIKALKEGKGSLSEAFCVVDEDELWLRNMFVGAYTLGTDANHSPRRQRKLLVHRHELKKWHQRVKEKGYTIVPLKLYLSDKGLVKLDIGLAKGKKSHDKRDSIKQRDAKREIDRAKKQF